MKFKDITSNKIIEVKDETKIKKFQGYPDLFEEIKEVKAIKEVKTEKETKNKKK